MSLNVYRHARDLAILWLGQQSDTDSRIPTAEELAATEDVMRGHVSATRRSRPSGLLNRPTFTGGSQTVTLSSLSPWLHSHPGLTSIPSTSVELPPLPSGAVVSRYDYLYLVAMAVQVGTAQDANVALTFQWRSGNLLQSVTRENTARLRSVYGIWVSQGEMSAAAIAATIGNSIAVSTSTPLVYGTSRLYLSDTTLTDGTTYAINGTPEVINLLRVWRLRGTTLDGWQWGPTEQPLEADIHLQPTYRYVGDGWDNWRDRLQESVYRLMRGEPLQNAPTQVRGVYNLLNGQVGSNTAAPGVATTSPNGSTMLANEQRITFTNEAITQTTYAIALTTTSDGSSPAKARATINFAGNSPTGATFASSGHAIFDGTGANISANGSFSGGGGTGALTWTATTAGAPAVGTTLYLAPAISYPAGSGLPVCGAIEKVYLNGTALSPANVRESDIAGYTNPAAAESYIVVMNRNNAAIQWIYRKFTVTSSGSGIVTLPSTARGEIAWISGTNAPTTRQDAPVITGLANNSEYSILCYHAPPAGEQWQFQLKSPAYAGTLDRTWLNGARVTTAPIAIAHSLGGGTTFNPPSRPLPDGEVLGHCVAWRLPRNSEALAVADHTLNAEINLGGLFSRNAPFVVFPVSTPEAGLAGLRPGQVVSVTNLVATYPRSMAATLTASGTAIGVFKPTLSNSKAYQLVIFCGLEKDGDHRFLVLTFNGSGNSLAASTDSTGYAGIDVFRYY